MRFNIKNFICRRFLVIEIEIIKHFVNSDRIYWNLRSLVDKASNIAVRSFINPHGKFGLGVIGCVYKIIFSEAAIAFIFIIRDREDVTRATPGKRYQLILI